MLRSINY